MAAAEFPDENMLHARMKHDWALGVGLIEAVRAGRLCVSDHRTRLPLRPDAPSVDVLSGLVSVSNLRKFVADLGYQLQIASLGRTETDAAQAGGFGSQATTSSSATVTRHKARRRSWWDVAGPYVVKVMQDGQYATAKELYKQLLETAGSNSPFDRGTGPNRGDLFVREIAVTLALKTVQNSWSDLLNAAAQK